jgi:sugar O-acyltransferase (sialic acid O-acetyltransferase NeuD family)
MKKLGIIGAGDLGQLIAHHAPACGDFEVVGFFDDFANEGSMIKGYPVLGTLNFIESAFKNQLFECLMCGIGYNHMEFRRNIFQKYFGTIPFARLVHSNAYVDHSVYLGEGCFVLPGCTVDAHAHLAENTLLNTGVVFAHDSTLKAHSFCGPGAAIAGKTTIGECCFIGLNSSIIDNLSICDFTTVAAGAVVTKSITQAGLYAGVPATLKK